MGHWNLREESEVARICPFCDGDKLKVEGKNSNKYIYKDGEKFKRVQASVRCNRCHARGPVVSLLVKETSKDVEKQLETMAYEAWNSRGNAELKVHQYFNETILNKLAQMGLADKKTAEHQMYTLKHKQAVLALELELRGQFTQDNILHDVDKLVTYGLMAKKDASKLHRRYAQHHLDLCKTAEDFENCVIDYESARYTKEDKPLNAYNTVMFYKADSYIELKPALKKFNIDSTISVDHNFSKWNHLKTDELQSIIDVIITHIEKLNSNIEKYGIEKGVEIFYKR